ncbi:PREDICTED: uncharacterized protein LOC109158725 [Ipomoea nil]|uniref:uncharacterized protein LOC109158725 n=1 Tax=Ipomoea nil TaxID=35883 RepID=UPI000901A6E6|nr:PREDICTED: uncharacterized protein LOC109158725 [Ipomoea nil]
MENCDNGRCVFPLTSLQIGDLQSYLSHWSIYLAPESKKFYILVDNRPWLQDLISHPAHLWQLMVTKSRMSPFANTRGQKDKREAEDIQTKAEPNSSNSEAVKKWFSLVDAATSSSTSALSPVKKFRISFLNSNLNRTLYGFIVFEVAWSDVRGINYFNELQTDTTFALEAKFMRRWEFDSMAQAARCISSWFSGTDDERSTLLEYLDPTIGEAFFDAEVKFSSTSVADGNDPTIDDLLYNDNKYAALTPSKSFRSMHPETITTSKTSSCRPYIGSGLYKRRKSISNGDMFSEDSCSSTTGEPQHSPKSCSSECENDVVEATKLKDILILFRFNDRDLPFKLRDTIMSDLRLLTLLECGLPAWVIFLQSYPGLCHIYRPWMCPLARFLYVLISIVTVLIGFYDLYKNVPLVKATASHLFGPFFDWIETWEMISRIRYLGTMLFLHNFQKALKCFLSATRAIRSCLSFVTQPFAGPFFELMELFLPLWSLCAQLAESLFSIIWLILETSWNLAGDFIEILLLPLWCLLSVFMRIVTSVLYPIFWIFWGTLYTPIRLVMGCSGVIARVFSAISEVIHDTWEFSSGILRLTSEVESTVTAAEVSMWRALWNDLFSQVFRALRSILNGFVAFFTACNRHSLSIYNHTKEFIQKQFQPAERGQLTVYTGSEQLSVIQKKLKIAKKGSGGWEGGKMSISRQGKQA